MTSIFFFIDQIALGIYIIIGAIIVFLARKWLVARSEYDSTRFELERDLARHQQLTALTSIMSSALIVVAVLGVQNVVVPFLQSEQTIQERASAVGAVEDGVFMTPTLAPRSGSGINIEPVPDLGDDDAPVLLLTPTLTPTPVGTIVANPPPAEGCTDPRATLQVPANGMRVFQPIRVIGTAYAEDFTYAKLEINGPGTDGVYGVVNEITQPLETIGDMAQFVPNHIEGVYKFRLMVFDLSNQPVASCTVNIYIGPPPVTPTPTPEPDL